MNRIASYEAVTPRAIFELVIFRNPESNSFVGHIMGSSPTVLAPRPTDRCAPAPIQAIEPQEITDLNLEQLIVCCKERMIQIGGPLINFKERPQ